MKGAPIGTGCGCDRGRSSILGAVIGMAGCYLRCGGAGADQRTRQSVRFRVQLSGRLDSSGDRQLPTGPDANSGHGRSWYDLCAGDWPPAATHDSDARSRLSLTARLQCAEAEFVGRGFRHGAVVIPFATPSAVADYNSSRECRPHVKCGLCSQSQSRGAQMLAQFAHALVRS
jgi:hypothetical protein